MFPLCCSEKSRRLLAPITILSLAGLVFGAWTPVAGRAAIAPGARESEVGGAPGSTSPKPRDSKPESRLTLTDFPLEPGLSWRYRTENVFDTGSGYSGPARGLLDIKVMAVRRFGRLSVAALVQTRSGADASEEFTWLVTDERSVHSVADPARLREVLAGPPEALDPADAELDFPLEPGKVWGRGQMANRPDGLYMNRVDSLARIAVPAGHYWCLPVEYSTLPDRSMTWVSPGVGVVRYEYVHNGPMSRETWDLVDHRQSPVDTAAMGRALDQALDRLFDGPDFWPRRSAMATDPAVLVLFGPLTLTDAADPSLGVRRTVARSNSATLILDQLPDGPGRAYLVRWRGPDGLVHVYGRSGAGPNAGEPSSPSSAAALDAYAPITTPLGRCLTEARGRFMEARRLLRAGRREAAGLVADAAAARIAHAVAGVWTDLPARSASAEDLKLGLKGEAGRRFLITRYGNSIRIEDGRFQVRLEVTDHCLGVWACLDGDEPPAVGAAPRVVRAPAGKPEIEVLWPGTPQASVRQVLLLGWSAIASRPDALVWSSGQLAGSPPAVEYYRIEEAGARLDWRREVPDGRVRLLDSPSRIELEYEEPDAAYPIFRRLYREVYLAPGPESDSPTLLRRDQLDPWVDAVAALVKALRSGNRAAGLDCVRDTTILDRIGASWLARAGTDIERVDTEPASLDRLEGERLATVRLGRSPVPSPANLGPEHLSLRLAPDGRGRWVVIDMVGGGGSGLWGP